MLLQGSLHENPFFRGDFMSSNKVPRQWIFTTAFSDLPIFCDQRMLYFEDTFGQGLASPDVFDIENRLDPARHASHCGDAPCGRNRKERHVAEPILFYLFDETRRKMLEEGILQMALSLEDRERTFHESDVCGLVVSPELDLLDCPFAKLDSLIAVVSKLKLAEHVGKSHDAQADPPV